jgi:Zinc knuckle
LKIVLAMTPVMRRSGKEPEQNPDSNQALGEKEEETYVHTDSRPEEARPEAEHSVSTLVGQPVMDPGQISNQGIVQILTSIVAQQQSQQLMQQLMFSQMQRMFATSQMRQTAVTPPPEENQADCFHCGKPGHRANNCWYNSNRSPGKRKKHESLQPFGKKSSLGKGGAGSFGTSELSTDRGTTSQQQKHPPCRRCNKNHPSTDCKGKKVTCYSCGKLGHRSFNCWSKDNRPAVNQRGSRGGNFSHERISKPVLPPRIANTGNPNCSQNRGCTQQLIIPRIAGMPVFQPQQVSVPIESADQPLTLGGPVPKGPANFFTGTILINSTPIYVL